MRASCKSPAKTSLSANVQQIATIMEAPRSSAMLLDCRSGMAYNTSHIRSAYNVFCPAIVKRRAAGSLNISNIITCSVTRQRLLQGEYEFVVVYDEDSRSVSELEPDATAALVVKTLEASNISNVSLLEGGFAAFSAKYPNLCTVSPHMPTDPQTSSPCVSDTVPALDQVVPGAVTSRDHLASKDKEPVQILPWLYLGCIRHAQQEELLKRHQITALLDISVEDKIEVPSDILYKKIPVTDTSTSDIRQWFPMAIDFIESVRNAGGRVLVHCHMGISRSATICLAYLIQHKKFTLDEAFKYIHSRRSLINPNFNFMRQLETFASEHGTSQRRPPKRKPDLTLSIASPFDLHKQHFDFCQPNVTVAFTSPFSAPCNIQASSTLQTFEFTGVPLSPLVSSSPLPFCHSPLLSPS